MSITLTLPDESLRDPAVAEAAAQLVLALSATLRVDAPAQPASVAAIPTPLAPAPAQKPAKKHKTPKQMSLEEFAERLPRNSQRFLQIVQRRGKATVSELVEILELPTPKAIGGITGAIGRWAPVRGITLPYEATVIGGQRAWRWIDHEAPDLGDPEIDEAPAKPAAPARPARVEAAVLSEELPEKSAKLLAFVEAKRSVKVGAALDHLGLSTARALAPHFKAIVAAADRLGVPAPIEQSTTATGERLYQVPGADRPVTAPVPPTMGSAGAAASAPGVRIRKRR